MSETIRCHNCEAFVPAEKAFCPNCSEPMEVEEKPNRAHSFSPEMLATIRDDPAKYRDMLVPPVKKKPEQAQPSKAQPSQAQPQAQQQAKPQAPPQPQQAPPAQAPQQPRPTAPAHAPAKEPATTPAQAAKSPYQPQAGQSYAPPSKSKNLGLILGLGGALILVTIIVLLLVFKVI